MEETTEWIIDVWNEQYGWCLKTPCWTSDKEKAEKILKRHQEFEPDKKFALFEVKTSEAWWRWDHD